MVGRLTSVTRPAGSMPRSPSRSRTRAAESSPPTTEQQATSAPSALRLLATLPQPPSRCSSRDAASTTMGASGETRSVEPYW
jgi:hypothetical protein